MAKREKFREPERRRPRRLLVLWGIPVLLVAVLGAVGFAKRPEKGATDGGGIRAVSFTDLSSFAYAASRKKDAGEKRADPFPPEIRALDGRKVSISGYIVPLHFDQGKLDSFYLSRGGFACCYADAPKVTDYIKVTMSPGKYAQMSALASVSGVLQVGEEWGPSGWIDNVYRMTADSVEPEVARPPTDWADYVVSGFAVVGVLILVGGFGINVLRPWLRARHIWWFGR